MHGIYIIPKYSALIFIVTTLRTDVDSRENPIGHKYLNISFIIFYSGQCFDNVAKRWVGLSFRPISFRDVQIGTISQSISPYHFSTLVLFGV